MRRLNHPLGNGIGGKSAGMLTLAELAQRGVYKEILEEISGESRFRGAERRFLVSIPGTTVLASGHFEEYAAGNGLRDPLCPEGFMEAAARAKIRSEKTLEALADAAETLEGPVAVRSSASCEDSNRRSPFAGNFTTSFAVLRPGMGKKERVEALLSAVNEVYSSFFGENVQKKMAALGIDPADHYMAVVLQNVIGRTDMVETCSGTRELHMPFASAVLASSSAGMQRPPGVGRDGPFMRLGFGLGTLVVAGEEAPVPCRVAFPDKPGLTGIQNFITIPEGRGHGMFDVELRGFLSLQDRFDAIDCGTGRVERINIEDVRDGIFLRRNSGAISILEPNEGGFGIMPWSGKAEGGGFAMRASFQGFIGGQEGRLFYEFAGRLARRLRSECGFDVDMEMAIMPGRDVLEVGIVQLRPFGSGGERVLLSAVGPERVIAKTDDCIGNGRHELDRVVVVTRDAMGHAARAAQGAVGEIDRKNSGRYLLIGPNITREIGIGGAYGEVHNPGLIISYGAEDASMAAAGTHMFNNIAMMRVIEAGEEALAGTLATLLREAEKVCEGVYVVERKAAVELDGASGRAQAYWVEK